MNLQTHIKPTNDPVDPGSDDGEEALDYDDDEENDTFLRMLLWMILLFSRQLNRSSCRHVER